MIARPDVLVGLDDTDVAGSPGTGRLARLLAAQLESSLPAQLAGVSRHQHLVDPRIPYTSRNSSACIALVGPRLDLARIVSLCVGFLAEHFQPGSDPGLCVAEIDRLDGDALTFARRTQTAVVDKAEALGIARSCGVTAGEHGGDGGGVIGALAAVALRADGNDGRFVHLPGIRDIAGRCQVADILARTPVVRVESTDGVALPADARLETRDWIRPDVVAHQPVVRVTRMTDALWSTLEPHERVADH